MKEHGVTMSAEVLQLSNTIAYHSDGTTLPYTLTEVRPARSRTMTWLVSRGHHP